jgi:pullulanase
VINAYLDDFRIINVICSGNDFNIGSSYFLLFNETQKIDLIIKNIDIDKDKHIKTFTLSLIKPLYLGISYTVLFQSGLKVKLGTRYVARSKDFDKLYAYDGTLGPLLNSESCLFKLWAPLAIKVHLALFNPESNKFEFHLMERLNKGLYQINILGNLINRKYYYIVDFNTHIIKSPDPYGKAEVDEVSILIEPLKKVSEVQNKEVVPNVIYELHLQDFFADERYKEKSLFKRVEEKLSFNNLPLGLDYLKSLNVDTIQIQPLNKIASLSKHLNNYNWGYDPLNHFCFEDHYNNDDPYTTPLMLQNFIAILHKNNFNCFLDVVFNHFFHLESTAFHKIVPYYYFVYNDDNYATNNSGCGNDFNSTTFMGRKYILDCIDYYLTYFDFDGFRFDLAGLIDIDTTNAILKLIHSKKKKCFLLGEGWQMSDRKEITFTTINNADKVYNQEYRFFNDYFREKIFGLLDNTNSDLLKELVLGNHYLNVYQSINYCECHDNMTLNDKLTKHNYSKKQIKSIGNLFSFILMISKGTPFIHMGQEFLQTKHLLDNTYDVKDINNFDNLTYEKNIDLVKNLAEYINLRKTFFSKSTPDNYNFKQIDKLIYLDIKVKDKIITVIFNFTAKPISYNFQLKPTERLIFPLDNKVNELEWLNEYSFICYERCNNE